MKKAITSALVLILIAMLIIPTAALSQPAVCNFHGTVTINGGNVTDGTSVKAWIDGLLVEETSTTTYEGDSVYSLNVEGNHFGKTVAFTVSNAAAAESALWEAGAVKEVNLTAGPSITVTPVSGSPGSIVSVVGAGFTPGLSVDIRFDGGLIATTTVDATRAFSTSFTVPGVSAGIHEVSAIDGAGQTASVNFTVLPRIIITPGHGLAGTTVVVTGTSMTPNGSIPVEKIVTRHIELDNIIEEGFEVLAFDKEGKELKIQVRIKD